MRFPRFVLALLLVGTPVATVAVTASSASADPFSFEQVSVGNGNICILTTSHVVLCKGDNYNGTLVSTTNERTVTRFVRINLPSGEQWASINSGTSTTHCGRTVSGRAFCWGEGRLGNYFTPVSRIPVQVEFPNDIRIKEVKAGFSTACAIDVNDSLWCWGDAHYIGNGDIEPMRIPVSVPMPDGSKIKSLTMNHALVCVTTDSNKVFCWGGNSAGQLGLGYMQQHPYSYSWLPVSLPVPIGKQWSQLPVAIGIDRVCAVTTDGTGYCAGDNYGGSFGNGTYDDSRTFVQMTVPNNEAITSISSGHYHTCLTTQSEKFYCFGDGSSGQLGTGTTLGGKTYRTPVLPLNFTIVSYSLMGSNTCLLSTESHIWCTALANDGPITAQNPSTNLYFRKLASIGTPTAGQPTATNIDAEVAHVSGVINSNGFATTATLELADNASFIHSSRFPLAVSLSDGSYVNTSFMKRLTSLAPRTTHYVRVVATNSLGSTTSETQIFTTLGDEPVVSAIDATHITANEATATFTVNPGRLDTTVIAEFSIDSNFQNDVLSYVTASVNGSTDVPRSVNLTGLQPRTRYYSRATATNRLGSSVGEVQSFLTIGSLPTVSQVTVTENVRSVSLAVVLTTGDTSGFVQAQASTSADFSLPMTSNISGFTSGGASNHQLTITGLTARTDYFIRAIVTNQVGTTMSTTESIRTLGGAPSVQSPIVTTTPQSTSLQLRFDANGLDTSVTLALSAMSDADDQSEHFVRQSDLMGVQTIHYTLSDLRPGETYFVTVVATNDEGMASSSRVSFTTPRPIGVVINGDEASTELTSSTLTITPPSGAVAMRVSNSQSFRGATVLPLSSQMAWELVASDEEVVKRTVFVQFYFRDGSSIVFHDDISLITDIVSLDEQAPEISAMSASRTRGVTVGNSKAKSTSTVTISARDRKSGVVRIETKIKARITSIQVNAARHGVYTVSFPKGQKKMHIRVIDKVGNKSRWITVTRK